MDFKKFYNEQKDYKLFRTDENKRKEYMIQAEWKVKNLLATLPTQKTFKNILEVGCAFGTIINLISKKINPEKSFGLDISEENINVAKQTYPQISFVTGTLENINPLSLLNGATKFDLIILSDIVEHIPDDLNFMKEVARISNFVLLNLPLEESYNTRKRNYGENDPSGHLKCYNEKIAIELINKSGFSIITKKNIFSLSDADNLKIFRQARKERLSKKPFLKKSFWTITYNLLDIVLITAPEFSKKIYGSNLFCLLESNIK